MSSSSTPNSRPSFNAYPSFQSPAPSPSSSRHETLNHAIRPNPQRHGHIPGVLPGTRWQTRFAVSQAGVHAPVQAGISGHVERDGAESVVLNGGYPYGDSGDIIWYMGAGGFTNPETNKKSTAMQRDQDMTGVGNKAMAQSLRSRKPVRVIRGPQANDSPWAPLEGYRYDGLYIVTNQINTVDPTHITDFKCYVWRMERIIEPNLPYEIPIRAGQEETARKRARAGRQRKLEEEAENASSLLQADQSTKRSSGFSCPGSKPKRPKYEEPSSTLPTPKSRYPCSDPQPVASSSTHRPVPSSSRQAPRPIYKDHHKAQAVDSMLDWNGMNGAKIGNVLKTMSFRKKPTVIKLTLPESNLDEPALPNIARSSAKSSSSHQADIQDRSISNLNHASHSRMEYEPPAIPSTTSDPDDDDPTSLFGPGEIDELSESSDEPLSKGISIHPPTDSFPKVNPMIEVNEDDEIEVPAIRTCDLDQTLADLVASLPNDDIIESQSKSTQALEAQVDRSRSSGEIDMDTATSSSTQPGEIVIDREQTLDPKGNEDVDGSIISPASSHNGLSLGSPICLVSSSAGLSPPALNPSSHYESNEIDEPSSRRSSPIDDEEEEDYNGESLQTSGDLKMMMEEDEEEEKVEPMKVEGIKTPLFRDPSMIEEDEEEDESLQRISTEESNLVIGSSTDLLIQPPQSDQPLDLVLGVMMNRVKDPSDGSWVVYDPIKGKYIAGEYEIEDDDEDDEVDELERRIEVKEEDEDATLLDLLD